MASLVSFVWGSACGFDIPWRWAPGWWQPPPRYPSLPAGFRPWRGRCRPDPSGWRSRSPGWCPRPRPPSPGRGTVEEEREEGQVLQFCTCIKLSRQQPVTQTDIWFSRHFSLAFGNPRTLANIPRCWTQLHRQISRVHWVAHCEAWL